MKVRMVLGSFWPVQGGAERQAAILARALVRRGADVEVVTGRPRGVPARLPDDPVPVTRLRMLGFGRIRQFAFLLSLGRELGRTAAGADLIHVHQAQYPAYAAVRAARRLGVPVLVKCSSAGARFGLDSLVRQFPCGGRLARYIARAANMFNALNETAHQQLRAWGVEEARIATIPNGVEIPPAADRPERGAAFRSAHRIPADAPLVATVGWLYEKKRPADLLRALPAAGTDPPPHLLFVGPGPLREELETEAGALGVRDRTHFTGELPSAEVVDALAAADVFVLPSPLEGMSNALLEALASPLPCVAADIPGNRRVVEDGVSALLYPAGDLDALRTHLATLLGDADLRARLAAAGRRRIEETFSIDAVADAYLALYARMRAGGRP